MLQRTILSKVGYGQTFTTSRQAALLSMPSISVATRSFTVTSSVSAVSVEEKANIEKKLRYLQRTEDIQKPPPRSINGWQVFLAEHFAQVKNQGVTIRIADEAKTSSAKWKALTDSERQAYKERATEESLKLQKNYEKWAASLTPEQLAALRRYQGLQRKKGKQISVIKDPAKPKKPLSAFLIFLGERRQALAATFDGNAVEFAKSIGAEWRSLSEAEKKPYNDKSATNFQKYDLEATQYRETLPKYIRLDQVLKPKKKAAKKPAKKPVLKKKKKPVKKVAKKPVKKTVKKVAKKPIKKTAKKTVKKPVKKTTKKA
ncbi:hypothetical protein BDF19DRAFT_439499 [Syncephalis fuscata]|nr:hypothetical protein BDF19DRAFT_439499 [Syncephalis fuscata]